MLETIRHRGPDGVSRWVAGPIGLGHLMFCTVPEDEGVVLPLVSNDDDVVVTMDGRIDNREDLIRQLNLPQHFLNRPDVSFVLEGYRRWGTSVCEHLLGDFALAMWDIRERRLLLARDHFGVRPLFYVYRPGRFIAFASEIKALRAAGFSSDEPNENKVAEFLLAPISVEPGQTFFRDVSSLRPAHVLTVGNDTPLNESAYWSLNPNRTLHLASDEEYITQFRGHFEEGVRCRMRTNSPIGSMLSGGLDSTSISCTAARLLDGRPLYTYSAVFDSLPACNERTFIEAALRKYPKIMHPTMVAADELGPLGGNAELTQFLDRPNEGINCYLSRPLHKRAKEQGVRVVLDGFDGDTTVSHGIGYLDELKQSWRWLALWKEIKAVVALQGGKTKHARQAYLKEVKGYLRRQSLFRHLIERLRPHANAEADGSLHFKGVSSMWGGDTWRAFFSDTLLSHIAANLYRPNPNRGFRTEREAHFTLLDRPIMEYGLHLIDAQGAAAGIEMRMPFFDVRLIEFCLSLPGHLKRREGWGRWIMRRAMDRILPTEVQWRAGKANLASGYINGLTINEKDTLLRYAGTLENNHAEAYINGSKVSALARSLAHGELSDLRREAERIMLWRSLSVATWESYVRGTQDIDSHLVESIT